MASQSAITDGLLGVERESSHWVGPVEFVSSTPRGAVDAVLKLAQTGIGHHVHLANAYTVALADKSDDYRAILASPGLNFPDGKPIVWASILRRHSPRLRQVRGPQLFLDTFDQGRSSDTRHFLLGSTPVVLATLKDSLRKRYPGVEIVGAESPPYRPLTPAEVVAQDGRIRESGAQIVWVGLGTPKQDVETQRIAAHLPVTAIAVGAAFDFAAGTLQQAPVWMTHSGLEWAFRLASEPRRLWRRYFFGNARFLKAALLPVHTSRRS